MATATTSATDAMRRRCRALSPRSFCTHAPRRAASRIRRLASTTSGRTRTLARFSGDFCFSGFVYWSYSNPDGTSVTITQTSTPTGCTGGLTSPLTYSFSGGKFSALDVRYTCPPPTADISVTKTASPEPIQVNGNLTYSIAVRNNGPGVASGVTLSDTLPAG